MIKLEEMIKLEKTMIKLDDMMIKNEVCVC